MTMSCDSHCVIVVITCRQSSAVLGKLENPPTTYNPSPELHFTPRIPMATDVPSSATPGKVLGPITRFTPGPGTHIYESNVVASLLGLVTVTPSASKTAVPRRLNKITAPDPAQLSTISVARHGHRREVLPDVGNTVLARVLRLMPRQAIVNIQQVGDTVLQTEWQGVIRVQDVRATEKDKVKIIESFKPGDIVRAQVVSLTDRTPDPGPPWSEVLTR